MARRRNVSSENRFDSDYFNHQGKTHSQIQIAEKQFIKNHDLLKIISAGKNGYLEPKCHMKTHRVKLLYFLIPSTTKFDYNPIF